MNNLNNYNPQSFVEAVNQINRTSGPIKGQYEELIATLRKQQTKLEPFVSKTSSLVQALNRRMKDLPDNDENGQMILQGLRYFRNMYNTVVNDIGILQKANDAEVSGDQHALADISDKVDEAISDIATINAKLNEILSRPELKGIATL